MTCKKQKNRKKIRHISTLFVLLLMTIFIEPIHGLAAQNRSLAWNTFLGGLKLDVAKAIASDTQGNLYVTGYSRETWGSPVNPHSGGGNDAFIARLDANGNRVWNTFLGEATYSDHANAITLDAEGNLYVAGSSENCGAQYPCYRAFVTKLDATGKLIWNSFEGGPGTDRDRAFAITLDAKGNIYVAGDTRDQNSGVQIGFVSKLDEKGKQIWHTFLGAGHDIINGIALNEEGNLYVAGYSRATWGSPVNPHSGDGNSDAFVARLDANGKLVWNTFMGGSYGDYAYAIASDTKGNLYVTGYSNTTWGYPKRPFINVGKSDAFVTKLDTNGNRIWNTFLGGTGYDRAHGITLGIEGNLNVAGYSGPSWGFPVNPSSGEVDGFVASLDANGNLKWNTFLGSSDNDSNKGIASDTKGSLYVTGDSDAAWGYPVNPYSGSLDVFVAKLSSSGDSIPHGGCFPYTPKGKMLMICWQNEAKVETELEGTWTQHTSIHSGIYETYVFSGNKYEYIYINQDLTNCEPDPNWDECNPEEWTEPGEFVIGESCISPLQESASKIYFHKNSNSGPIVKVRSYYIDEGMDNALIFGDENCSNFSYGADGAGFQKQ